VTPLAPAGAASGVRRRAGLLALLVVSAAASFGCAAFPEGTYWPRARAAPGAPLERLPAPPERGAPARPAARAPLGDRVQANVTRRWADEGLARSARRMSAWAGRCTYADALGAIGWCYVDPVRYGDLVGAGIDSLRGALENAAFRGRFPEAGDAARRARFAEALEVLALKARAADPWLACQAAEWLDVAMEKNRAMLGLPDGAVVTELLFGAMDSLDPYTRFVTPEMRDAERLREEYVGVGIEAVRRDGRALVRRVFEGGPADRAGLAVGDEILAVDGRPAPEGDLAEWLRGMRGKAGSTVRLTIRSPGAAETREVDLVRRTVRVPPVEGAQMLGGGVAAGYVRLRYFGGGAAAALRRAVRGLARQGAKSLILDLRDNPGGSLLEAVEIAGLFLPGGRVLEIRGRMLGATWKCDVPFLARRAWRGPMTVLVNAHTASASEALASALAARGRAVVVGRRTFGKGAAQIDLPVAWGSAAVHVTIARVYDPSRACLESRGVAPPVAVEEGAADVALEDDPDVRAALEHMPSSPE